MGPDGAIRGKEVQEKTPRTGEDDSTEQARL